MSRGSIYRLLQNSLLVLNIFFLILLLFSYLASYLSPGDFPFIAVFGLLFFPLVGANLFFLFVWALLKSKLIFLTALILLIGSGNLGRNFQMSIGSKKNQTKWDISLLTYNVQRFGMDTEMKHFGQKRQQVVNMIKGVAPDIVCLQEYHGKGVTLYEPLQQTKKELGARSYYYESYFNPRYQQLTGLVIFSKYEAVNKGRLKFEGTRTFGIFTDVIAKDDTIRIYNIHLASIQLKPSDIDFVVNPGQNQEEMHLHALQIYAKLTEAYQLREKQANYLLEEIRNCPHPVLLSGDFNDTPSSYVYRQVDNLLTDAFRQMGSGFGTTYAGRIPFLRIDYAWSSEHFQASSYHRIKVDYSDHYPVVAGFRKTPSDQ